MSGTMMVTLLEKMISLDFEVLNETFQMLAQLEILTKSLLSAAEVRFGSLPTAVRQVSSAKRRQSHSRSCTMSLMYIMNRSGPNRDPCGIPAFTGNSSE